MSEFPMKSTLEMMRDKEKKKRHMVHLNVYDLTPANNYLYLFGVGIFHSGIEVHGMEYGFGAHEYPTSGIFEVEPRNCPGFIFRRSILLGSTNMSYPEFHSFIECLSSKYHGDTYHLIAKNCNHFTDEVCQQLTGKPIPAWINRLARVGSFCNCLLPESLQVAAVRHLPEHLDLNSDDEGSEYDDLIESDESEEEDSNHPHLITSPDSRDVTIISEKPITLARDLL
ncbi:deSI-like protein At4g17486 [Vigna radiata var. radiata]|uniref:DeSI-like protein At4g17486 n=1 Tax=Vigna radiata var. radiata TaxID=3916 RepID=A0A1S3UP00_VIGRR|nr:deSI-like protein At4g17486 [Vigna radiata var. radiata]